MYLSIGIQAYSIYPRFIVEGEDPLDPLWLGRSILRFYLAPLDLLMSTPTCESPVTLLPIS